VAFAALSSDQCRGLVYDGNLFCCVYFVRGFEMSQVNEALRLAESNQLATLAKLILELEQKLATAVEALGFYADPKHWTIEWVEGSYGDYGTRARAALEKVNA
jgi:hypothetical protein